MLVLRHRHRKILVTLATTSVLVTLSACNNTPDVPDEGTSSTTTSASPTAATLPEECSQEASPPADGNAVFVVDRQAVSYHYDEQAPDALPLDFGGELSNTSDMAAINVEVAYTFSIDGKDVTSQLEGDFASFDPQVVPLVMPSKQPNGRPLSYSIGGSVNAPREWEGKKLTMEVATTAQGWCTVDADSSGKTNP